MQRFLKGLLLLAAVLPGSPALGNLCFDFGKKVTKPLMAPLPLKAGEISSQSGSRENGEVEWASARGVVNRPIGRVLDWILDHKNWKDMSKTNMEVTVSKKPGYLAFHTVSVNVNVWAFIWIDWVEQWGYALTKGTSSKPEEVVVSYQKISGTSHIEELCGSVVLRRAGSKTDMFFYEEAKASRYKAPAMIEMHRHFLTLLNK